MSGGAILALNAGSSSIKFGLFRLSAGQHPEALAKGLLQDQGSGLHLTVKDAQGTVVEESRPARSHDPVGPVLDAAERQLGPETLVAVGHRIVHGGRDFHAPIRLDPATVAAIEALTPLAPLHQPRSLEPIRALQQLRPGLPQVGCFDTAFHKDLSWLVSAYALPRRFEAAGVRKYGFHGLSYDYVAGHLAGLGPELAAKRTIVAHLGQGASLCAMRDGRSLDTTMGFSALDGLMMGTRCGALDPAIVLYLQRTEGLDVDGVERLLYTQSGLLGVAGRSGDMRELLGIADEDARRAVELFTFRAAREAAGLLPTMGGLDLLVFTGGIGEHSPEIRAAIGERLAWLGVAIEARANERGEARIDARSSRVEVRVVATDEEAVIARDVAALLARP